MYARYTEYLREIMLNPQTKPLLDQALSTYPLYQPTKSYDMIPTREQLNTRLLNHYKYREIGFETVGRFLDELEIVMCNIMPKYNELFKTVEIMSDIKDPFGNVDVTETFEQTTTGSSTSEGTSEQESNLTSTDTFARKFSDTPQNSIENLNDHLTDYAEEERGVNDQNNTSGTSTSTSETTGTVRHTFHKEGNQGVNTYAHDMIEFRETIRDIVDEIINNVAIADLFMKVY